LSQGVRRSNDAGFGLLELVVAVSLLALAVLALAAQMGSTMTVARNNRNRSIGANLASREMDLVRSAKFSTLPLGLTTSTYPLDGVTYTIKRASQLVPQNASTGACDGGPSGTPSVLRVTITVSWPNMAGAKPVTTQTAITPPVGNYDPDSGNIAVKVTNRDGNPSEGRRVTITGPSTATQVTTSDGCAFFGFARAGTYTVQLTDGGYVDRQGNLNPSLTNFAVPVGQTKSAPFDYDLAATATIGVAGFSGGTVPAALPLSVANPALLPTGTKAIAGTGYPRTLQNLFPFTDGAEYFAGDCPDADPEAPGPSSGLLYPSSSRAPALALAPGGTATATVVLPVIDLRVVNSGGAAIGGATVELRHAANNGASWPICTGGRVYPTGTTAASGPMRVAVPNGKWFFQVTSGSTTKTTSTFTVVPSSTVMPAVTVTF
jgi:Tfp pilus assembly protein PilV